MNCRGKTQLLAGSCGVSQSPVTKHSRCRGEPRSTLGRMSQLNARGLKRLCFGGWGPYRKTWGTTAQVLRDGTFRVCGSLQHRWLNDVLCSRSHCVWVSLTWRTEHTSVGTNDRVLKVSAVQAPCRIDPSAGSCLHKLTNRFDDHQSSTPFTRHIVPPSVCRSYPCVEQWLTDSSRASLWTSIWTASIVYRLRRRQVHPEGLVARKKSSGL
jgi:hypothetical protein